MFICLLKNPFLFAFLLCLSCSFSYEAIVPDNTYCDNLGTIVYEDLGCVPVFRKGVKCPVQYNCNLDVKNNTCTFRGQTIPVGSQVNNDDTYGQCTVGCFCDSTNKFVCAVLDCFDRVDPGSSPDCYNKYELDKCCSVGTICPTKCNPVAKCSVDGQTILEGQRFFPNNSCTACICSKGYKGQNVAPFCSRHRCLSQIYYSEQVKNYCAPYYDAAQEKLCCPSGWVCPSSSDERLPPNPKAPANTGLTCKYGSKELKWGERIESTAVNYYGTKTKVHCECILPPLLTCKTI